MRRSRLLPIAILGLFLLLPPMTAARAQADPPARDNIRELIYHVNAFQGAGWQGVFYPQSSDTLYLIAGEMSTLNARMTMVYFWPLTQRYLPDWSALDEPVQGKLEIYSGGVRIDALGLEDFVLQDPTGQGGNQVLQLYVRATAHERYNAYKAELETYWEALRQYARDRATNPDLAPPQTPSMLSTDIGHGYIVNLPAGEYRLRLVDLAGAPIAGSEKKLIVFAARRSSIGYQIIPETKWTVPEQAPSQADSLYIAGEGRLFATASRYAEYNAFYYTKLLEPQAPGGDPQAWKWVALDKIVDGVLNVSDGQTVEQQAYTPFKVNQIAGSAFGYQITPLAGGEEAPSFWGHPIPYHLAAGESLRIWMTSADDKVITGSERQIRSVHSPSAALTYLPAVGFGLAAVGVTVMKKSRLKKG